MDWIRLALDRDKCRSFVNKVISGLLEEDSEEKLCSMDLVSWFLGC